MVVTVLTGTGDRNGDTGGMPRSNTGDLAETLVSLARQLGGAPSLGDTWKSVSKGIKKRDINIPSNP